MFRNQQTSSKIAIISWNLFYKQAYSRGIIKRINLIIRYELTIFDNSMKQAGNKVKHSLNYKCWK